MLALLHRRYQRNPGNIYPLVHNPQSDDDCKKPAEEDEDDDDGNSVSLTHYVRLVCWSCCLWEGAEAAGFDILLQCTSTVQGCEIEGYLQENASVLEGGMTKHFVDGILFVFHNKLKAISSLTSRM